MIGVPGFGFDVPVDPDAQTAHDWLVDELAKPAYQAAQPTWFDNLVQWVQEQIYNLLNQIQVGQGSNPVISAVLIVIVVGVLVVAFLIFGLPRLNRRSRVAGELFGDDDDRDAATMRRDAERAAASGDYTRAIAELYRALARGMAERTIVSTFPGTTAHDFANRAGIAFPAAASRLVASASVFDGVRYLDRVGTAEEWADLVTLERELRTARPAHLDAVVAR